MFVVTYRKFWFILSGILLALSAYGMITYGFNYSIDFKGGTITEVKYSGERPDKAMLEEHIKEDFTLGGFSIRPSENDRFVIRTRELSTEEKLLMKDEVVSLHGAYPASIERQNTVGPVAGEELRSKALKAIILVVIMIVLFVTYAFRKVSKPVSSWKYGLATIIALFHDVVIPTGVFIFLGHYFGHEIDLLFVTGLLAILGYSVHDTIVVFDRVRENLRINNEKGKQEDFTTTVGNSVQQTFGRSINTSLTIFITLLALYLFGGETTKDFALLLIVGVIAGTYSSIFVASPLLVTFQQLQKSPIKKNK
jgi:preprotein translocase subunit SecF